MTKNENSPENLRKFLESDDPALVRMGLSMAKGSGVPDELLTTILGLYMWNDDKGVRGAAKSVFNKYAPAEIRAKVKENWKTSYRTLSVRSQKKGSVYFSEKTGLAKIIPELINEFKSKEYTAVILYPYTKILKSKPPHDYDFFRNIEAAAEALGELGELSRYNKIASFVGPVTVKPLIQSLELHKNDAACVHIVRALKKLGHVVE